MSLALSLSPSGEILAAANGHSVAIPLTIEGVRLLRSLLYAQIKSPSAKIGSNADPTIEMVEAFLKTKDAERAHQKALEVELAAKELMELF